MDTVTIAIPVERSSPSIGLRRRYDVEGAGTTKRDGNEWCLDIGDPDGIQRYAVGDPTWPPYHRYTRTH